MSEDLSRVTLVGNSSGGTVATGVAEGERVHDVAWVLPRLRPTPLRDFTERLPLGPSNGGEQRPRVYLRCTENNAAHTSTTVR